MTDITLAANAAEDLNEIMDFIQAYDLRDESDTLQLVLMNEDHAATARVTLPAHGTVAESIRTHLMKAARGLANTAATALLPGGGV
jgi:hypothetical protein